MTIHVRDRKPPVDKDKLYGEFARDIANCQKLRDDIRDRAAYLFITGCLPSHLRNRANAILLQISRPYRRPSSLDSRLGYRLIHEDAVRTLRLESHEMVKAVRLQMSQGFLIQLSFVKRNRRSFSRIFMFKRHPNSMEYTKITVTREGAIKDGWD